MKTLSYCAYVFVAVLAQLAQAQKIDLLGDVVSSSECQLGSDGTLEVNARILLRAQNNLQGPILLFRKMNIVSEVKVAKSRADALGGTYLFTIENDIFPPSHNSPDSVKQSEFTVVPPGGSYERTITHQFMATNVPEKQGALFHPGQYWVQLTIIPVPIALWTDQSNIDAIRKKWAKKGRLYADPTTTQPFIISVRGGNDIKECK